VTGRSGCAMVGAKVQGVRGKQRIRGIDGARGWLAWAVVAGHILPVMGLDFPGALTASVAGDEAVLLFIVISGFVITHLILAEREPYPLFIARRFLRIYPVYLVCLALGVWTALRFGVAAPEPGRFVPQLLVHLLLLQGAVPDELLRNASMTFVGPAWSLSLEWQFYLIAPLVLALLRRPAGSLAMLLLVGLGIVAFQRHDFGTFDMVSFLPGAGAQFAVGVGTRLALDRLRRSDAVLVVAGAAGALLILLHPWEAYLGIWVLVIAYARLGPDAVVAPALPIRIAGLLLDSRWARAAGRRSFPVYLIHMPIITVTAYMVGALPHLGRISELLELTTISVLLTIAGSELLHRLVERPAIAFGRRLREGTTLRIARAQPAD